MLCNVIAEPKKSLAWGVGLSMVCTGTVGVPLERSYKWTLPAATPLTMLVEDAIPTSDPERVMLPPKFSLASGSGLLIVCTGVSGVPLPRSKT